MTSIRLAHEVRRRARELVLAYRIAASRLRDGSDRQQLKTYERALERLVLELGETLQCEPEEDPARLSPEWLGVGAMRDEPSILRAVRHLEEKLARRIASMPSVQPEVARSSEERRAWLEERADALEPVLRVS